MDFHHASQHLWALAYHSFGEKTEEQKAQARAWVELASFGLAAACVTSWLSRRPSETATSTPAATESTDNSEMRPCVEIGMNRNLATWLALMCTD